MTTEPATLIMESNGFAPSVRSATFTQRWSRLYQAGPYFLDMTLKPEGKGALLQGQVLHQDGAALPADALMVLGSNGEARLGATGDFQFFIDEVSELSLEARLNETAFVVEGLAIA